MTEEKLNLLWAEVVHVGKVEHLEYDAMVALGSVFGKMKHEILEQQKEIERLNNELTGYKLSNQSLSNALE